MVVAILLVLLGLATPLLALARRHGGIANTQALQAKVLTALDLFRDEVGAYPYLAAADSLDGSVRNRLAYHLAHRQDDAERAALAADLTTARRAFTFSGSATLAMSDVDIAPVETLAQFRDSHASMVNRLAATRARVAIMAGYAGLTGFKAPAPATFDRSAVPVLPTPSSLGWGDDYLGADILAREVRIDPGAPADLRDGVWQILDRWLTPLVYVNPVIPGVAPIRYLVSVDINQGPYPAFNNIPVHLYQMTPRGRGETATRASSITTTASASMLFKPELWSAGPDRTFDDQRDAAANRDNIPASIAYHKGLQ